MTVAHTINSSRIVFRSILLITIFMSLSTIANRCRHHASRKTFQMINSNLMSTPSAMDVKITTYNVLSSHLGGADYYTSCKPEWLKPSHRLAKLKQKLDLEISKDSIICLQEISTTWAADLHSYLSGKGYYLITGLYGRKFNGYMGVGIAVPLTKYDIQEIDITTIADTKKSPPKSKRSGFPLLLESKFLNPLQSIAKAFGLWKPPLDVWKESLKKQNQMVCVRLAPKEKAGSNFVVGTYHMPCMFRLPQVMSIHCALSAQHLQRFAKESPFVFAGDFNIKPSDSMYTLMTQGEAPMTPVVIPSTPDDSWKLDVVPMRSAYKEKLGTEPPFTNWAQVKEDDPFIDTLDYIFLSQHWSVSSVAALPTKEELQGPLPIEEEPSDHLLLSACLSLTR